MRYPKPWQIGNVDTDQPSDIPNTPRLSTIEILDSDEQIVCSIRTYSQYIAQDIITAINEYDKINKVKKVQHCADCFYCVKDMLNDDVKCVFPKECSNKNLFVRKE